MVWSVVGSIVGGLIGRSSSRKANATNLKIARETNEANKIEAHKGRKFAAAQAAAAFKRESDFNKVEAHKARLFNANQVIAAREFDKAQADLAYRRNTAAVDLKFARDVAEVEKARAFETAQARDQRIWAENQTIAAEQRQRGYLDQDRAYAEAMRDQDRQYADPAAVRARLEAAGFNPLSGSDMSAGIVSSLPVMGMANIPAGVAANAVSPAESGIAEMMAVQSGVASAPAAAAAATAASAAIPSLIAAQVQPDNFGSAIADAFAAYGNYQTLQAEQALRRTQIEMENARITDVLQRARERPVVEGIYSEPSQRPWRHLSSSAVTHNPSDSVSGVNRLPDAVPVMPDGTYDWRKAEGRPGFRPELASGGYAGQRSEPVGRERISKYIDVYDDRTGRTTTMLNPDLLDAGPVEMMTGATVLTGLDYGQEAHQAVKYNNKKSRVSRDPRFDFADYDTRRHLSMMDSDYYRVAGHNYLKKNNPYILQKGR